MVTLSRSTLLSSFKAQNWMKINVSVLGDGYCFRRHSDITLNVLNNFIIHQKALLEVECHHVHIFVLNKLFILPIVILMILLNQPMTESLLILQLTKWGLF